MNISSWNVQRFKGKMEDINQELLNLGMELVALREMKRNGIRTEIINNYIQLLYKYIQIFTGVSKNERAKYTKDIKIKLLILSLTMKIILRSVLSKSENIENLWTIRRI